MYRMLEMLSVRVRVEREKWQLRSRYVTHIPNATMLTEQKKKSFEINEKVAILFRYIIKRFNYRVTLRETRDFTCCRRYFINSRRQRYARVKINNNSRGD